MAGQIIRRGEGKWLVRWYTGRVDGKRLYSSKLVHGTKKQAERLLREQLAKQDRGFAVPSPSSLPTLRAYVERWKQGETAAALRARTLEGYLDLLKRHVFPRLGETRLDAIHSARIEADVVAPLRSEGKVRTARHAVCALSRVYRTALKDPTLGLFGNPCAGVEIGKKQRREIQPLDAEERKRFREAIWGTDHETFWLVLMLTGLSPNEALGLGWEHVDLDTGALHVRRTLDCKNHVLIEDTKRPSRRREVPLVPELRQMLRERWMEAGRPASGLVFVLQGDSKSKTGEAKKSEPKPLDLDNLRGRHFRPLIERAAWKRCAKCGRGEIEPKVDRCPDCESAKLETRAVRIYDLRHGFGTAGLEAGLDVKDVATLMGHSSTRVTQDVYQHVSEERRRASADRIAQRLSGRD